MDYVDKYVDILLYADDIVLISDNPDKLQNMLDNLYNWSRKWRIKFNCKKTSLQKERY